MNDTSFSALAISFSGGSSLPKKEKEGSDSEAGLKLTTDTQSLMTSVINRLNGDYNFSTGIFSICPLCRSFNPLTPKI